MYLKVFLIFILLSLWNRPIDGAKILAITPVPSPSHHIWNRVLLIELAKQGHEVIYFGPDSEKTPTPNLTHVHMEGMYEDVHDAFKFEDMAGDGPMAMIKLLYNWLTLQCEISLKSKTISILQSYKPGTIDLVVADVFGVECFYPIIEKLGNPPVVLISPFGTPSLTNAIGGYEYTSFIPYFITLTMTEQMTLTQRIENLFYNTYSEMYRKYIFLPNIENFMKQRYGDGFTPIEKIEKNISLALVNTDPLLDWVRPLLPQLIPVAGLHVEPAKPLPQNIKNFLDGATNGAIIFSLGSNLRSDSMDPEKLKAIIEALRRIPQRVLWKWESDHLPGKPENVMVQKWLPQSDSLAHKNVKAIVTHGGMMSVSEANVRGTPMVIIPFFGDQHGNARRASYRNLGLHVDFNTLTADSFEKVLREIVDNPMYRENAKKLSDWFHDQPQTPLERGVFWIEYVLRHKSTKHLQCQAVHMPFYQTYSLDAAAVLILVAIIILKVVSFLLCFICSFFRTKDKLKTA